MRLKVHYPCVCTTNCPKLAVRKVRKFQRADSQPLLLRRMRQVNAVDAGSSWYQGRHLTASPCSASWAVAVKLSRQSKSSSQSADLVEKSNRIMRRLGRQHV